MTYDRLVEWHHFNDQEEMHIEQYTKAQYGDEQGTEFWETMTLPSSNRSSNITSPA